MSSYYSGYGYRDVKPSFPKLNNPIKIDWSLFYTLLYKQSPSQSEHQNRFVNWLKEYLHKQPGVAVTQDKYGNLYAVKGQSDLYPCVVAHTDINQDYKKHLRVERNEKFIYGMDMETGQQCGVGFDDKNGCLFALMMLERMDTIKVAFFKDEEIGAVGSKQANASFFHDCSMIFQMDRNSYKGLELITQTNGAKICSKEFVDAAEPLMKKYHVNEGTGSFTDVGEIVKLAGVNCIGCNIGAGYFDEHSEQEITSIQALENSINFGYECLTTLGKTKWIHKALSTSYGYGSTATTTSTTTTYYDRYQDEYDPDIAGWNDSFGVTSKPKDPILLPNYQYRHVLEYDGITDSEIVECLEEGYCPCCFSKNLELDIEGSEMISCYDCGSYFFVPEDYFDGTNQDSGILYD